MTWNLISFFTQPSSSSFGVFDGQILSIVNQVPWLTIVMYNTVIKPWISTIWPRLILWLAFVAFISFVKHAWHR